MAALYSPRVARLRAMFARLREQYGVPSSNLVRHGWHGPTGEKGREGYSKILNVHRKALNKARFLKPLRADTKAASKVRHAIKRSLGDYGG